MPLNNNDKKHINLNEISIILFFCKICCNKNETAIEIILYFPVFVANSKSTFTQ